MQSLMGETPKTALHRFKARGKRQKAKGNSNAALKPSALLSLRMNMSGVGILPARKYIETGKMPVPPRCQFHQDASSTKMPIPPRCPFHQTIKIIPHLCNA
ncbi:hypothetical protein [Moorena producens]|uniref:hypothetical protein n=1 Tax=Moorena producens TaxID=1155739 RepID=UPI0011EA6231|nr:hypothetical protein [Moorena producens]